MTKASVIATVAAIALAACANQSGMVPSSPSEAAPPAATTPVGEAAPTTAKSAESSADSSDSTDEANDAATHGAMQPLALKTCATSPPQYQWIFKGACDTFTLKPTGGTFSLDEYSDITVKGLIGKNTLKASAKIALADAVYHNGDIKEFNGKPFPKYKANGTTYVYAAAVNQSSQTIKPITVKGKPVLQYVITDAKGFGDANTCSAAVLTFPRGKPAKWTALPATGQVKGKSVTINQYTAPSGFELPPQIPLYFGVNCYKQ